MATKTERQYPVPTIRVGDVAMYHGLVSVTGSIYEVRVMAIAEGYAMVRRKRASPFVAPLKTLKHKP